MNTNLIFVNSDGQLTYNGETFPCAIGKGGIREDKSEGDGATPVGVFPIRKVLYRADRLYRPDTTLPVEEITKSTAAPIVYNTLYFIWCKF
jgi:L,D-peptidoglycan transpeptidase YkuD (ErfK/YbiS/YcfS/YnhG family)